MFWLHRNFSLLIQSNCFRNQYWGILQFWCKKQCYTLAKNQNQFKNIHVFYCCTPFDRYQLKKNKNLTARSAIWFHLLLLNFCTDSINIFVDSKAVWSFDKFSKKVHNCKLYFSQSFQHAIFNLCMCRLIQCWWECNVVF